MEIPDSENGGPRGPSAPDVAPDSEIVALLTDHQVAIRLYVHSLMPGDSSALDVVQQTNATLWQKRGDFELGTNFKAWAFSIARYEVLNYRKRQARDARLVFNEDLENVIAEELPNRSGDFDSRREALAACLAKLKDSDRNLIVHRYFKRAPLAEYAEQVGRSVGGLKVTLHRIRNALQKCIQQNLLTGEARP